MDNRSYGFQDRADKRHSPSFVRLFGQMVMLPFTVFVQGMELFIKTIQEMQKATDEGMNVMAGQATQTADSAPSGQRDLASSTTSSLTDGITRDGAATTLKEEREMDQDLSGEDTLKLVRYKILFVKRDYEWAFDEKEDLVSYSTTAPDWAALKISEFTENLKTTRVPEKWKKKNYPKNASGENIMEIPSEDRKYIRIYFEVLQRWDREEAEYDKQQVEVLREIREEIGGVRAGISGRAVS
jgi:hypothetical protein